MKPIHISINRLARDIDVPPNRISAIIDDSQPHTLTSDIALRLARRFRTSPQFWLGLQTAYDLAVAEAEQGAEIAARVQPIAA